MGDDSSLAKHAIRGYMSQHMNRSPRMGGSPRPENANRKNSDKIK